MKQTARLLLCLFVLLVSCKKENNTERVKRQHNLSYGSDPRNKLDIFLPAERDTTTPFILLIHGGAWLAGDKNDLRAFQESLLVKGIASASINYRYVSSSVHYPQLMEDVGKALTYCRSKAGEWKIRSTRYLVGGASAGGHMSLLYGYKHNEDNLLAGIVSVCGPTDMTDTGWLDVITPLGLKDAVEKMTGSPYVKPLDSNYVWSSPLHYLRDVPTLMIHGTHDVVVFYSQAERLEEELVAAGIPHKLLTVENAGHDLNMGTAAGLKRVTDEIAGWVMTYGK